MALWLTWRRRPDVLARAVLSAEDRQLIDRFERGETPDTLQAPAKKERDGSHGRDSTG